MQSTMFVVIILVVLSVTALLIQRNAIKLAIALTVLEGAIFLFAINGAHFEGAAAPIIGKGELLANPLPHALVLTAIVIGASTTALALSMIINLFEHTKSLDLSEMRELRG